jgi:hypothetical protein
MSWEAVRDFLKRGDDFAVELVVGSTRSAER